AQLMTGLQPMALLKCLQAIETRHGRLRPYRNAPRSLDLDLLLHGEHQLEHAQLQLPHPRMHQRAFVMVPLAELQPGLILPGLGALSELLDRCPPQSIERLAGPDALLEGAGALVPVQHA
ncbi:MAG: 2-amino-4-hydroxy-6-hydroxymethyldihydropteridine diphosphokinase, partial [Quisquiliibacterium sp.]